MTKEELQNAIKTIQAHLDGKPIQIRRPGGDWRDQLGTPTFDFARWEYRVKPKTVKVQVIKGKTQYYAAVHLELSTNADCTGAVSDWIEIEVRE